MRNKLITIALIALILPSPLRALNTGKYPRLIRIDSVSGGHVQGICVDESNRYVYLSFTTKLVKADFNGRILGTIEGLYGHLGCIVYNKTDGKVYGTLEYKNDEIGKGILQQQGKRIPNTTAFYVAIFDVDKMRGTRMGSSKNLMRTVYLNEVAYDYAAKVKQKGKDTLHRYGCSGIDGICFGPAFGKSKGKNYLTVAYGIYGDTLRTDNDYQVLLQYDVSKYSSWQKYEQPLLQDKPHRNGPLRPHSKTFLFTGNTTYGIQNLEYDSRGAKWYLAVYSGHKTQYPNYNLYSFSAQKKPSKRKLTGVDYDEQQRSTLDYDKGWHYPYGSTGLCALSTGDFYVCEATHQGKFNGAILHLVRPNKERGFSE